MPVIPPANLPPESTPWGREMQNRLEASERDLSNTKQSLSNLQRTVDSILGRISQL